MVDWETNDSGGMDEEQAIKKMIKVVESFNKTLEGSERLGEKSQVQLMKSILSHEKAHKTDKDHQRWKIQDREQSKKNAIEIFQERQNELRLSKLINKRMGSMVNAYDGIFKQLGSKTGLGEGLKMLTGRFNEIRKATENLVEAELRIVNEIRSKGTNAKTSQLEEARDIEKKKLDRLTSNNQRLKDMGTRLTKIAEFMEKHQGKLIIGAAAISILTGIISKALNVAPLFQAMMKLMQFAFTMVLMPIGTFFGAVIKPMVIGLVKKLAPEFGKWMDTSMAIGNALGMFLTSLDLKFFENIGKAISNLAKVTGVTDYLTDPENATTVGAGAAAIGVGGVVAATVVTKKVLGNLLGGTAEVAGKSGSKTAISMLQSTKLTTKLMQKIHAPILALSKFMPNLGKKMATEITKRTSGLGLVAKLVGGEIAEKAIVKGGIKVGLKAIPIVGWATLIGDAMGSVMKEYAPEQYEGARQGAFGIGAALGDDKGEWTEKILDVLGFGKQSTWEQIQEGFIALEETFAGSEIKGVVRSMENAGDMAAKYEEVATIMGTENAPVIDHQMSLIMGYFINMKKMGMTSNEAAISTADNFVKADQAIKDALASWVNRIKTSETASGSDRQKANNAQSSYLAGVGDADNFFGGGSGYVNPWTKTSNVDVPSTVRSFDYNQLDRDGRSVVATNEESNQKVRDEIAASIEKAGAKFDDGKTGNSLASKLGLTSTGAVDWSGTYAAGGWINEPVRGIGMNSGQSYSIGERGAEFVSPNGGGSGGGITINIAKIERTADFNQLKPMIQRWILEANSRRGMI